MKFLAVCPSCGETSYCSCEVCNPDHDAPGTTPSDTPTTEGPIHYGPAPKPRDVRGDATLPVPAPPEAVTDASASVTASDDAASSGSAQDVAAIIERLERMAARSVFEDVRDTCRAAAEALARLAEWKDVHWDESLNLSARIAELEAEVERLREAGIVAIADARRRGLDEAARYVRGHVSDNREAQRHSDRILALKKDAP